MILNILDKFFVVGFISFLLLLISEKLENLYEEKIYQEIPEWDTKVEEEVKEEEVVEEVQKSVPGKILRKQPNRYLVDLGNGVQEWMRKRDYFKKK